MCLAETIQSRRFGVRSHTHGADFVNDHAAIGNSPGIVPVGAGLRQISSTRRLDQRTECLLHIFRHLDFAISPLEVEAQHRDTPLVHNVRIDIAIAVEVGNHFAAPGKANLRTILLPTGLL